jgi:glutathione S-transferase
MRLYQFAYSPFAAKVRKCLELKQIAFETVEVPYLDRRALLAATGGSWAHVPVLVDGDRVITDSPRITAYLDARYAPSLRPSPAATVYEQWADQILEDVAFRLAAPQVEARMAELNGGRDDARAMYRIVKERKFGAGCIERWHADEGALQASLRALTAPLAEGLAAAPFLLGERPTLADAAVWGNLYMVESVRPGEVARLGLADWYARVARA